MKIKAFTILELLLVLAISGILVGFFFTSIANFQRYLSDKSSSSIEMNRLILFKSTLREELMNAELLSISPKTLTIYNKKDTISYQALPDSKVARKSGNQTNSFDQIEFIKLEQKNINENYFISFQFKFRQEEMEILSPKHPSIESGVNDFYTKLP